MSSVLDIRFLWPGQGLVEIVELASVIALHEALDEAAHFAGSRRVELFAGIDKVITERGLESEHELGVLFRFFLFSIFPGHGYPRVSRLVSRLELEVLRMVARDFFLLVPECIYV